MKWRVLALLAACAGCGVLSGLDTLVVGDGAAPDAPNEASPLCEAGTCGATAGFAPVLFAGSRDTSCPTTTVQNDIVVDPSLPPNTTLCSCACDSSAQAMCLPSTLQGHTGDTCSSGTSAFPFDGGCLAGSGLATPTHASIESFGPVCTSTATANGTAQTTDGRMCVVSDCSQCAAPSSGFALCQAAPGDVPCPPLMQRHVVATSAQIACSACKCQATGKCGGTITIFDGSKCSGSSSALTVDGTCQGISVTTMGSITYAPVLAQNSTCNPGTSSASLQLAQQVTICCP